jgi:hypothetical protein
MNKLTSISNNGVLVLPLLGLLGTLCISCAAKVPQEAPAPEAAPEVTPAPETEVASGHVVVSEVGFATPECVLNMPAADVYLVSNINGSPFAADGNGFVSRLAPDGTVMDLKWIDGAKEGVTLNAPKGMGVSNGTLYITDVDHIRMFDAETGAPKGELKIENSTFLNDVAVSSGGTVYVSDSGFSDGFVPSGSDAIYKITAEGVAESVIAGEALGHPNGLLAKDSGELVVVTFGSGEVYTVSGEGKQERSEGFKPEQGSLDGIIALPSGEVLVSSWASSGVYKGTENGPFTTVIADVDAPADIGWDGKRNRVLIPLFKQNSVVIHELK